MAKAQGPLSGFRDLLSEQIFPREVVLNKIKSVYELYGFVPLKTPALEQLDTLTGKYGDEGDKLMYSFTDNGGRRVALRYDHTVPLARVVAQHSERLPKPYKRYTVADVWRGERPQAGRFREFTQFDADIVGTTSYLADTEIISMTSDVMNALGLKVKIRVNDRRLLDGLAEDCDISKKSDFNKLVGTIDKVDKIGIDKVLEEITKEFGDITKDKVYMYLVISGSSDSKLDAMEKLLENNSAKAAVKSLRLILETLAFAGYDSSIVFDQTIARGLSYYTGTIYETTLVDLPDIGSICSGGRYDNLIEQLGGPDTPAVGTSIGVDRMMEAVKQLGNQKEMKTKTKVYITNIEEGLDQVRFKLVQHLRKSGIAAEIVYDSPKLGKQILTIDKLGVEKIIILGSQEMAKGVVMIKDLKTGAQKEVNIDKIIGDFQE